MLTVYKKPCSLYKKIQHQAGSVLWSYIKQGFFPWPKGTCCDCGGEGDTYDHRSYDEPLKVDLVCRGCNWYRGHAVFSVLDPETLNRRFFTADGSPA